MKRRNLINVLVMMVSLIVVMVFCLVGCDGTDSDVAKVKDAKTINVGITIYQPMDYFDEDGETIIGFDADLANEFAESLGVRARFTLIAWDEKVAELNGGYIDLIWNGMTASEELGKSIDFSTAYATNYQCVVVKKANVGNYNSSEDLKNKTVAVESGSAGDTEASKIVTTVKVDSQLAALQEVVAGTSDCAVIDYTMAYSLVGSGTYADLEIVSASKVSFDQEVFAIGARQGSDLVAELNKFLVKKYEDGSLKTLAIKYGVAVNDDAFRK